MRSIILGGRAPMLLSLCLVLAFPTVRAADVPFGAPDPVSTRSYDHRAADVDDDGDLDLFATRGFGWVENVDGQAGSWTEHNISVEFGSISHFDTADFDGDGDLDLVTMNDTGFGYSMLMYEQTAPGVFTALPAGFTDFAETLEATDMDGDGDADILFSQASANRIAWYENVSDGSGFSWTYREVTGSRSSVDAVAADLDGDGDTDVLSSGFDDDVVWFASDGGSPAAYSPVTLPTSYTGSPAVTAGDIDADGDVDVVVASGDTLYWHENDGATPPGWSEHLLSSAVTSPRVLVVADLDGDGDGDLVSGGFGDSTVRWHENLDGDGSTWADRTLSATLQARRISVVDIDGEGDLDVVVSVWGTSGTSLNLIESLMPEAGSVPNGTLADPLLLDRAPGNRLSLTWSPSCLADGNYGVYEGTIGSWNSHQALECDTHGATSMTIDLAGGNRYYLVVPHGTISEGSYGLDDDGNERPASASPCAGQKVGACP